MDIHNPDLTRGNGQSVFVDYQDFTGFGTDAPDYATEAFEDDGSIAAQGREVYTLGDFSSGPKPCRIRVRGVAPGASLVGLVAEHRGQVFYGSVGLAAINYAVNVDHVNVINESFGAGPFPITAAWI